jgi:hypothetical protein
MTPIAHTASAADMTLEKAFSLAETALALAGTTCDGSQGRALVFFAETIRTLQATNTALQRELAELKATNSGLEKDAARYRWLRERGYSLIDKDPWTAASHYPSLDELDREVDAALAASAGERKGDCDA